MADLTINVSYTDEEPIVLSPVSVSVTTVDALNQVQANVSVTSDDSVSVSTSLTDETQIQVLTTTSIVPVVATLIVKGINGLSAYELALQQGFTGTLDEWLASLKATFDDLSESDKVYLFGAISDAIRTASTAQWAVLPTYVPGDGQIIIYTDRFTKDGVVYPGIKVGDGNAYIADLPFLGLYELEDLYAHIHNVGIHITLALRQAWNNKVTCYIDSDDATNLVFSKE